MDHKQYLHKEHQDGWKILTFNEKDKKWIHEERITLFFDKYEFLMIFIKDLNTQDSGTYRIGVDSKWSIDMNLKVKEGAVRCIDVIGYSRGSVLVDSQRCWHKDYKKYIYKKHPDELKMLINNEKHNAWINKGRFSLFCNESRALMIFIGDLNTQDSGTYQIGVDSKWSVDMSLKVKEVTPVFGDEGGSAMIICPYDPIYTSKSKKLLKSCTDKNTLMEMNRWSVNDDMRASVFSVNITGLTAEDAGKYCCAVTLETDVIYLYTHLIIIIKQGAVRCIDVIGYSGGSVLVDSLKPWHMDHKQYLHKKHQDGWKILIFNEKDKKWIHEERITLFFDKYEFLMIYIRDLNTQDSGTYRIGVDGKWSIDMNLNVKEVTPVFGDEGGSAQIICPYDPIYKSTLKKLLKSCTDKNTLMEMNRWSVNDDMTATVFSVNITGLTAEDAGKYCCAVTLETDVIYLYTHLIIIIKQELLLNKSEGDNMSMECKHHAEYQKVFCKAHEVSMCVNDGVSLQSIRDDGFSLSDETSTGVFTVNISHLREEHSGIYWCGSLIITKVHLNVTRVPPVFGDEGGSAQIICPYNPIYKSTSKKLLKSCTDKNTLMEMNRLSVNDDMTASVFSVNITGLTAEDAGKYCCAVTLETDVIYLYTHLIIIIKQELLLNKSEGDNMSMECKHHAEYQKVFCKAHEVSMCVNDGVSLQSIRDDGFSLSDETSTGVFTVNISHLREEHSGIYWCGSLIITKVHLNVTRGAVRCIDVIGYSGGSVLVDSHKPWHIARKQYLKTNQLDGWNNLIYNEKHTWVNEGRFTLYCNTDGKLMIFIRDVNTQDSGTYQIGVDDKWYINMTLNVKADSCCGVSERVMVNTGQTANFTCQYSQDYKTDDKIILKEGKNTVDEVIYTNTKKQKERLIMSDNRDNNLFSMRITDVRLVDAGVYLCGVYLNEISYSYSILTAVHLHIMMPPVFGDEGGSAQIMCPYDPIYKSTSIKLLKSCTDKNTLMEMNRWSINDNMTATVFSVNITGLTAEDAGKYCCAVILETDVIYLYTHLIIIIKQDFSTVIIMCVCVLLLIGGITLIVCKFRRNKTPDNRSSLSRITTTTKTTTISSTQPASSHYTVNTDTMASSSPSSLSRFYPVPKNLKSDLDSSTDSSLINNDTLQENAENVSVCYYEEIPLTNVHPEYSLHTSGEHDASVYALAQNDSSNDLHYSTIEFTDHPERTSDGQTSSDYATVVL
ncbi:Polymeric immunoglobulin receptor [Triplophysa tibetana]|nr:Polymeric immunoglobulin receptor [Triplophysa tibetana]